MLEDGRGFPAGRVTVDGAVTATVVLEKAGVGGCNSRVGSAGSGFAGVGGGLGATLVRKDWNDGAANVFGDACAIISCKVRAGAVMLVVEIFSCACACGGAKYGCEILRCDFAIDAIVVIDLRQELVFPRWRYW